jgi:carboxylate-amine ligase
VLGGVVPTLWVEEELLLLWPDGEVARVAPELLAGLAPEVRAAQRPRGFQVEVATAACSDLTVVSRELSIARRDVAQAAADRGARLVAVGTPPFGVPGVADASAAGTFHVHVGVPTPDLGAAVLDRVRPWLPALLALTGNSPYWCGRDTGWDSYRYVLQRQRPRHTLVPPPRSADAAEDDGRGVSTMARLSPRRAAVEFRVSDTCATVAEAVLVAGLCRGLVTRAVVDELLGRPLVDVPAREIEEAAAAAALLGRAAPVVSPGRGGRLAPAGAVLGELVASVAPTLEALGDAELVTGMMARLLRRRSGADRQRLLRRPDNRATGDRESFVQALANLCAGVDGGL